jgi:hypothetical protein
VKRMREGREGRKGGRGEREEDIIKKRRRAGGKGVFYSVAVGGQWSRLVEHARLGLMSTAPGHGHHPHPRPTTYLFFIYISLSLDLIQIIHNTILLPLCKHPQHAPSSCPHLHLQLSLDPSKSLQSPPALSIHYLVSYSA